jgi:hypothetical protein
MEALSDDANEDTGNPIMKPKTRSPAQIESFKKAQAIRIENAKAKKEKLENMKETIKIDRSLSVDEKEESGLAKLQREREEIEKKILAQGKLVAEKKHALRKGATEVVKQSKASPAAAVEEEIKEKEQVVKKQKKEPKVIYQDASESEEEVVIVKKKKKQPKVVYESESEEEAPPPKPKSKPAPIPVSSGTMKQPQIIKTNQIRFF